LRVFSWLLIMDILKTKDLMMRKQSTITGDNICVLCETSSLETCDHLFLTCPIALECWDKIHIDYYFCLLQCETFCCIEFFWWSLFYGGVCMCSLEYLEKL
jgi:hypothetical protein